MPLCFYNQDLAMAKAEFYSKKVHTQKDHFQM